MNDTMRMTKNVLQKTLESETETYKNLLSTGIFKQGDDIFQNY